MKAFKHTVAALCLIATGCGERPMTPQDHLAADFSACMRETGITAPNSAVSGGADGSPLQFSISDGDTRMTYTPSEGKATYYHGLIVKDVTDTPEASETLQNTIQCYQSPTVQALVAKPYTIQ